MSILSLAFQSLYLLLPGLIANMVPPLVRKIDFLDYPIDFKAKWRGKPLFGSHKTFRGFFFGILIAIFLCYIQSILFINSAWFQDRSLVDYSTHSFILLGFLMGFGALFGDLIESFFKRRVGVKSGRPWIPFDQLDFVVGSLLFLFIVFIPPWQAVLFLLISVPVLHITTNHIGYYLGINKCKW